MTLNEDQGGSFEARLQSARRRQGLDKPPETTNAANPAKSDSALSLGLKVGAELVSALIVAVAIGWGLDHWLHTLPLFLSLSVLLGGAAGIRNVWRLVGPGSAPK